MHALIRVLTSVFVALVVLGAGVVPTDAQAAAKPSAKHLSVTVVAAEGGTRVTITGKHLTKVSAVSFGSTTTTKVKHVSSSRLIVTAPKHAPGVVKLKLRVAKKTYSTSLKVTFAITKTTPTAGEGEVLRLTNQARTAGYTCVDADSDTKTAMPAVPALTWNAKLAFAARGHSSDMATNNYFSHTSRDGTTFSQRITRAGYRWSSAGENIAAGYATPAAVVTGWLRSYGHCTNIMSSSFSQLGVGLATGGHYGTYWTQDFGRPLS
jgi:uncharacterized protein YkwD